MYLISTFGTLEYNNHIIDVKSVVVDYLKRDVEILDRAITNLYYLMKNGYSVIPSNFYTITGLAYAVFRRNYYKTPISALTNTLTNTFRNGYFGGATNVFISQFKSDDKTLYYYDVNSLYSYCMLQPMPFSLCYRSSRTNLDDLKNVFGMVKAKVQVSSDTKYPLLCYKNSDNGKMYQPVGE